MSENTQGSGGELDVMPETDGATRARAHEKAEYEKAARDVENGIHLQEGMNVRDIILAHPGVRMLMVATAIRCMGASKFYYSKGAKEFKAEPDYATQMKAVTWLAAYSDGLPIQTNLNVNANANGKKELNPEDMLAQSPAALEAMERTLKRAREKAAEKKTAQSQ